METIQIENRQSEQKINLPKLEKVAQRILSALGCPDAFLSVVLVNDSEIRELNRCYLGRDRATNVISFPMQEGEGKGLSPLLLGDVVISTNRAFRDAQEGCVSPEGEIYFLLIHGILHLTGFNHENVGEDETRRMEAKENELFSLIQKEFLEG
jgi:probable rRNA maturation factor